MKAPRTVLAILSLLTSLAIVLCTSADVMAEKTSRGKLKPVRSLVEPDKTDSVSCDTIFSPSDASVLLSGYDKPLHSSVESIFVSNRLDKEVSEITLRIVYTDTQGRQLHEVTRSLPASVPPGETRRLQFSSWDRQNTFYYVGGRKPRTANVSPYDVKCFVNKVVVLK